MKNNIPKWAMSLKFWALTVAAVFAVWAGATAIGLDLPRPAWIAEHKADVVKITAKHERDMGTVGEEFKKMLQLTAANACAIVEATRKRLRNDDFAIKDRAETYKQKQKPIPQWIKERQRTIRERQRENAKRQAIKRCP